MNSCHNHLPYDGRTQHDAQDGWTKDGRRKTVTVVSHWDPDQCTHPQAKTDPGCEGCCWLEWYE